MEALCDFVDDSGGFPKRLQCDFDTKFLGGKFRHILKRNHARVTAAPPRRQSQNGLVERTWAVACQMARAHLMQARLRKSFWFWAVREALTRMNMIPVAHGPTDNLLHTTLMEMCCGVKPDANTSFTFGSVGFFVRERDSNHHRTKMESQSLAGIAVGGN